MTWEHDGWLPLSQTITHHNAGHAHASAVSAGTGNHKGIKDAEWDQARVDREFYAIVSDLSGLPRDALTRVGDVAWRNTRNLWGAPTDRNTSRGDSYPSTSTGTSTHSPDPAEPNGADAGVGLMPLGYGGQHYDPETSWYYNRYRHYDPHTTTYTTQDPLGLAPAPNPTRYVTNPTAWTDPLGLAPNCCKSVPYGPVPEKASQAFERIQAKGAPPPGWKGGGPYKNTPKPPAMKLPDSAPGGGPIKYKEWDVAPKGPHGRGAERIVTGDDGSAYYTSDHYESFIRFN